MKKFIFLIMIATSFFNCSESNMNHKASIQIRLSNVSEYDFDHIVVNTSTGEVDYGNLAAGQTTDYKSFETAYAYAFVQLEIDGKTYTIQPIDYMGATPLEAGNYTYQINANSSQDPYGKLTLSMIQD